MRASARDDPALPAVRLPLSPRHGPATRLRALRARLRGRGRVDLRGHPRLGRAVRLDVAPGAHLVIGDEAVLGDGSRVHVHAGTVEIGEGATLGERCAIVAHAGVWIGAGCRLGDEVVIFDFHHRFEDVEVPIRLQGVESAPVRVEAGAIVDPRAALLRGVRIGAGARVGAHAVVTRDVAPGAAVEGAPARPPGARPGPPRSSRRRGSENGRRRRRH